MPRGIFSVRTFQLTRPWEGATPDGLSVKFASSVSTHAPVGGRDSKKP